MKKLYDLTPLFNLNGSLILMFALIITFCLRWCPVFIMSMRPISIIEIHIFIQCRSEFFF